MIFPPSIRSVIDHFNRFPGIGPKTSERFMFYLLRLPREQLAEFAESIRHLKDNIVVCSVCFTVDETSPCARCADPKRDHTLVCVVAENQDIVAIDKTEEFAGVYHVLGGTINHLDGIGPEHLRMNELLARIDRDGIREVILALNPDLEGETTALYLSKLLKERFVRVTRLARGLSMGSNIEYADQMTLTNALKDRKEV